jgi:endonuclease-8
MPEGPEIRLAADTVAAAIVGKPAQEVTFAFDRLKPYEALLTGDVITAVTSRGKAMLTQFASDYTIYSHNQLYGKWVIRDAYDYPETNRQLRLAIHTADKSALLYSASDITVLQNGELDAHPFLSRLGPDALDTAVTPEQIAARFMETRFRRKRLSTLLLDQGFLAGLGNYLRSEICFVAGVHPSLRPIDCTAVQINSLATASLDLTRQSYRTRGITNDLALVETLKAQGTSYRDYRWWVFGREGRPCYTCGMPIVKEPLGGRRAYFCQNCQPCRA